MEIQRLPRSVRQTLKGLGLATALIGLALPAGAAVQLDEFGSAALSILTSVNIDLSNPFNSSASVDADLDGGQGESFAGSSVGTAGSSLARAETSFAGSVGLPELKAQAVSSGITDLAGAVAVSAQRYSYVGAPGGSVSFTANLDGTNTGGGLIQFSAYIYRIDSGFTFPDVEIPAVPENASITDIFAAGLEALESISALVDLDFIQSVDKFESTQLGDATVNVSEDLFIDFDGVASNDFFLVASLTTVALAGGDANAFDTLSFDTANGNFLVPAAVPVPGAIWLLASAMLGLVGLRRRAA